MKATLTLLSALLLAPLAALHAADFVLVAKDTPPAPIVVPKDAPPGTREAAMTLADYLGKICGKKPAVMNGEPSPMPDCAIWVGFQPALRPLFPKADFEFQHPEETLIVGTDRHVAITGRDRITDGKQLEHGTSNAVFTFIEKDLGVRWLWPGALGTEIPMREQIAIAPFERRFHPPFRFRRLWPRSPAEWYRAQRLLDHSLRFEAGHGFTDWWEKYHEQHPDYFALRSDGTRTPENWGGAPKAEAVKLCESNPAVAEQWLSNAVQAFQVDPTRVMLSASPNDGAGFCYCDKCRAMDHPDGPPIFGHPALTDRMVKFWNVLARGLGGRLPGREAWVGAYAYSAYRTPPVAQKLEPNIAVGYVGHFPLAGEETRRAEREQWLAWSRQAKAMVYRPNLFHYSGGFLGLPCVALRKTAEDFRFLAEHGCIGIDVDTLPQCWGTQGVQYYLMAQLAYDPMQDAGALLSDYYSRGFGAAAMDVAAYFAELEKAHDAVLERIKHSSGWAREATQVYLDVYTKEVLTRAETHLLAAEAKVAAGDAVHRQRVEFIRTGFDATKLQIEILRTMKQVRTTGGKDAAAIRHADELCQARDALYKRYNGLACRSAPWYIEGRRLADYVSPPNAAMRQGTYKGPDTAPDMKGRD